MNTNNSAYTNSGDNGKSLDYGACRYDPRKARRDMTDPYEAKYPSLSPYNYVANSPLMFIDPDGNVVEATTEEAQKYVVNSVESAYRDFVTFDKKGILDLQKLSEGIKEMSKLILR